MDVARSNVQWTYMKPLVMISETVINKHTKASLIGDDNESDS